MSGLAYVLICAALGFAFLVAGKVISARADRLEFDRFWRESLARRAAESALAATVGRAAVAAALERHAPSVYVVTCETESVTFDSALAAADTARRISARLSTVATATRYLDGAAIGSRTYADGWIDDIRGDYLIATSLPAAFAPGWNAIAA